VVDKDILNTFVILVGWFDVRLVLKYKAAAGDYVTGTGWRIPSHRENLSFSFRQFDHVKSPRFSPGQRSGQRL